MSNFFMPHKTYSIYTVCVCVCIRCIWQCERVCGLEVIILSAWQFKWYYSLSSDLFSVCMTHIHTPWWFSFYLLFTHTETHFFPLHNFQHTVKNLHWNVKWKLSRETRRSKKKNSLCRNCTHLMHHKTQACEKKNKRKNDNNKRLWVYCTFSTVKYRVHAR